IPEIHHILEFIKELRSATLENGGLPAHIQDRLRNPLRCLPEDLDADTFFSLRVYMATVHSSERTYEDIMAAAIEWNPNHNSKPDSLWLLKCQIAELTGVEPLSGAMCVNSCTAFSGPWLDLESCPLCGEARYDEQIPRVHGVKKARQEYYVIPPGPQIQSIFRTPEGADMMSYLEQRIDEALDELETFQEIQTFVDICVSSEFLALVKAGTIIPGKDTCLFLTIDGAQLYHDKESDLWIWAWVFFDIKPGTRYKRKAVFPGGFIPGPHKPKYLFSYLYLGLHHVEALGREGLQVWNARTGEVFIDHPFIFLAGADGPGMAFLTGLVGHQGRYGCRLYCPQLGRRKGGGNTYYPTLLLSTDCTVLTCSHPDIDPLAFTHGSQTDYHKNLSYVIQSQNTRQHNQRRLETGIVKPSILMGLTCVLGMPRMCTIDLMHANLNMPQLFTELWTGTIGCDRTDSIDSWTWRVLVGELWTGHGRMVSDATPYLPGFFDRPPRDPSKKVNSGYKCWEFLLWQHGLCPAFLRLLLPPTYWWNFCKFVAGMRIVHQWRTSRHELQFASRKLADFCVEFEEIYCKRREDHLHFCRPVLHLLPHLVPETYRHGPLCCYAQWVLERTIGSLGQELRQPSKSYANISQQGVQRCQANTLKSMYPPLNMHSPEETLPRGSEDLGSGYILLRALERYPSQVSDAEQIAITEYMNRYITELGAEHQNVHGWWTAPELQIQRWAQLRLPIGCIVRCLWKESLTEMNRIRISRNVKVHLPHTDSIQYGETRYFFRAKMPNGTVHGLAMLSLYSQPDAELLEASSGVLWSCDHLGDDGLVGVDVCNILAVVAMVPDWPSREEDRGDDRFFLVEKPGLDVGFLAGYDETAEEEGDE
ncbi:hypothetical protein PUNSTDRAFT_69002, partial [Punctularia strigosozonata HHB-11173 SS5]|uniref:uncharacterized protein n=1 Tax=Punctularia strigosozonata (strain HHB-11173) TaxID=741275 RepID=UPI0004416E7F